MQQHTFLDSPCCSVLTWTGKWHVGPSCWQILSSKSGILWIDGAFKTTGNSEKTRVNHDVSDLQRRALERGQSSRLGNPSWMTAQNLFSVGATFFPKDPSCLELTKVWDFPVQSFQLFWTWQKSCWITEGPMYSTFSGPWCCLWILTHLRFENTFLINQMYL